MKKNKIVLFDIDYTLFDTAAFRKKLYDSIIKSLDLNESLVEKIDDILNQVRKESNYFNPEEFSTLLASRLNQKEKKDSILNAIYDSNNFKNNYYEEVLDVLEKIYKIMPIGIFSKGVSDFQIKKLNSINHLLQKDHINVTIDKHAYMPNLFEKYKDYDVFLVDDALDVLCSAKKMMSNITTIWIKRGFYADRQKPIEGFTPDVIIENLQDIIPIISK